jgi:hypothetical protein
MTPLCACGCGEDAPKITKSDRRKGWVKGEFADYKAGHYQRMRLRSQRSALESAPKVVQLLDVDAPISQAVLMEIRAKCSRKKAAEYYDARTRRIEFFHRSSFIEQGLILNEMQEQQLFEEIIDPCTNQPFTSFDRWLKDAAPVSRSGGYAAMRALNKLRDVPFEQLRHMPRCNVEVLQTLSSNVLSDPDILESAQNDSEKEFISRVEQAYPDQHVESKRGVVMRPEKSARKLIDEAFGVAMWAYEVTTREDAMENMVAYFMDGNCEREGYSELSNREAYLKAKGAGKV